MVQPFCKMNYILLTRLILTPHLKKLFMIFSLKVALGLLPRWDVLVIELIWQCRTLLLAGYLYWALNVMVLLTTVPELPENVTGSVKLFWKISGGKFIEYGQRIGLKTQGQRERSLLRP